MKYGDLSLGQIEAIVNKLGGIDGVKRLLADELEIKPLEFWRVLDETGICIPALKRPTLEELQRQFSWIVNIERDVSPTEEVALRLGTVLRPGERGIPSSEHERRLASRENSLLGYQQAIWLLEHQTTPIFEALFGKVYIEFFGLIVVNELGHRFFPYFPLDGLDGKRWRLIWISANGNRNNLGRVASK